MRIKRVSYTLALFTLVALATSVAYASIKNSLLVDKYQLKPLVVHDYKPSTQSAKYTVAMVFQPDCPWCKKQAVWLNKATERCADTLDIMLLGINGNVRELKRELKHYSRKIPAYKPNRKLFVDVGGIEASPTTLIFDDQGNLIAKRRGVIDGSTLTQVASELTKGQCSLSNS